MRAQDIAAEARQAAIDYLAQRGITILDRDWDCPEGQIPIIARDRGTLVAVEIVTRSTGSCRSPLERLTRVRQTRLRRAAARWLSDHGQRSDQIRIDVIGLLREGSGGFTIEHIRAVG